MSEAVQPAQLLTPEERHARMIAPLEAGRAPPWQPGQSGNPRGRAPKAATMIAALLDEAVRNGKIELVVNEYFELMFNAKDQRLRFEVMRDFFDRMGMKAPADAKVAAQIVNVVRANSPDLNL